MRMRESEQPDNQNHRQTEHANIEEWGNQRIRESEKMEDTIENSRFQNSIYQENPHFAQNNSKLVYENTINRESDIKVYVSTT